MTDPDEPVATQHSSDTPNLHTTSRYSTGERILYTIFFTLILHLVAAALGLIILFELIFTLITMEPPTVRIKGFANRLIGYGWNICQYMTYNRDQPPFPFEDFPPEG